MGDGKGKGKGPNGLGSATMIVPCPRKQDLSAAWATLASL